MLRIQFPQMTFGQTMKTENEVLCSVILKMFVNSCGEGADKFLTLVERRHEPQPLRTVKLCCASPCLHHGCFKAGFSVLRVERHHDDSREVTRAQLRK